MNHSTPGLPVHHQLLESTQTLVHWVGDATQPSHPLSSPSPPVLESFPASGSFQTSQLSTSGGQSIGVSASTSVLPKHHQFIIKQFYRLQFGMGPTGLKISVSGCFWGCLLVSFQHECWQNSVAVVGLRTVVTWGLLPVASDQLYFGCLPPSSMPATTDWVPFLIWISASLTQLFCPLLWTFKNLWLHWRHLDNPG